MRYVKLLVLSGLATVALLATIGAGTASATKLCKNIASTLTCSEPYPAETQIHAVLKGPAVLEDTLGNQLDKCTVSTFQYRVENAGGAQATVAGPISSLTWGSKGEGCEWVTETVRSGRLEVHQIVNTDNGKVTSSNLEVTDFVSFLGDCIYGTGSGIEFGTLTGGSPATLDVNAVLTRVGGSAFCPSTAHFTATFEVTSPTPLYVTAG
jgi:hypothetical protein